MKRIILLGLIIFSFTVKAQNKDSISDCKAGFRFEVNHEIMTFAPATVLNFYDTSVGKVKEWYWDFGNEEYSREQNPMHIFNHPLGGPEVKINPYRTITLTILTDSCKSFFSQTINILDLNDSVPKAENCKAMFKYYETGRDTVGRTCKIAFVNYSSGEKLSYFWQFGDGTTSTDKEPIVKYNLDQQEYKVCLTVTGADSCSNIFCDAVYITPGSSDTIRRDCDVAFGYEREDLLMSPQPSAFFKFYYKSYPEAAEWYWDFGDGTTSNEPNPTHVYIKPYTNDSMKVMYNPFRTVCLTIKTADECKVSTCETIQVFDFNTDPSGCQAYFKYYKPEDVVSIPEVVPIQLNDVTEGNVISRLWKFEDGSTSTEKDPLKTFSIFQPYHKVCLTVTFADSCVSTFCDAVYVNGVVLDTVYPEPGCPYYIKVDGGFPVEMSSCAGWASVKVYNGDSLVTPVAYSWSTGDTLVKVGGLCPAQTYAVKVQTADGCVVSTEFILGADGSVSVVPMVNWWLSGGREKVYVRSDAPQGYKVEWLLCNGMVVIADSIPLFDINCGSGDLNFFLKDSLGNVIYSENISLKGSVTGIPDMKKETEIKIWPNPVSSKLNIRYFGEYQSKINVEICDVMGKMVSTMNYFNIASGQEFTVNTESLKQGIYFCRISAGGRVIKAEKFSRR